MLIKFLEHRKVIIASYDWLLVVFFMKENRSTKEWRLTQWEGQRGVGEEIHPEKYTKKRLMNAWKMQLWIGEWLAEQIQRKILQLYLHGKCLMSMMIKIFQRNNYVQCFSLPHPSTFLFKHLSFSGSTNTLYNLTNDWCS